MMEEDKTKLAKLFEEYKEEYLKDRGPAGGGAAEKRRKTEEKPMQEIATGSGQPAAYGDMDVGAMTTTKLTLGNS